MNFITVFSIIALFTDTFGFQSEPIADIEAKTKTLLLFNGSTLAGWESPNFGTQGRVYVKDGVIILGKGYGCTGIRWKGEFPKINYKVSLEAMRVNGNDFFCAITFQVLEEFCTLVVGGWGGSVVGLSNLDGDDAFHNSTGRMITFRNKRWYRIRLLVTKQNIKAWLDNKIIVDFERYDEKLSIRREMLLSRPFGITSWKTTAAVRNIRVRKIIIRSSDE